MLRSLKELKSYKVMGKDGALGKVDDFFFDDKDWVVRYTVDNTVTWLPGRKVLISTDEIKRPNIKDNEFRVSLTKDQIKESPKIMAHQPVSKRDETDIINYYGWSAYWTGANIGGLREGPIVPLAYERNIVRDKDYDNSDPNLRSFNEVTKYHINAQGEKMGQVDDLLVDDKDWSIKYLIIDVNSWLPGKKVLIAPEWLNSISYYQRFVSVPFDKDTIKSAPEFDNSRPVNDKYIEELEEYYSKQLVNM